MEFEWDEVKNRRNIRKRGFSFETAMLAFTDPLQVSVQDRVKNAEERWQTLGSVDISPSPYQHSCQ